MDRVVRAVLETDSGWRCPYCGSGKVQAVRSGFEIYGDSADLMVCIECEGLYVVYADWFLKEKSELRGQYPKDITVAISDDISEEKNRILSYGMPRIVRRYGHLLQEDLNKGRVRYSDFVAAHPETQQTISEIEMVHRLFVYAADYLPDIEVGAEGTFKVKTVDGYSLTGDDVFVISTSTTIRA